MTSSTRLLIALLLFVASPALAHDNAFLSLPISAETKVNRIPGLFNTQTAPNAYAAWAGTQLRIRPDGAGVDGERVVVESNALDFSISLDGKSIFYTKTALPGAANIFKYNLATGEHTQLTNDTNVWNFQPVEGPGGTLYFLSNRDKWVSPRGGNVMATIYAMNADGSNQRRIWHAGHDGIFGLMLGPNGRLYFATGENFGQRLGNDFSWGIWSCLPDGGDLEPQFSAIFTIGQDLVDWPTITTRGALVVAQYYRAALPYGAIWACPLIEADPFKPSTKFGDPLPANNPHKFGHERVGMYSPAPWASNFDGDRPIGGKQQTKLTHPYAVPGNGVYVTSMGFNGVNNSDLGVYAIPDVAVVLKTQAELVKVVDEVGRHEWMGKPVVPYAATHGSDPAVAPATPQAESLPPGSPWAVIGSSATDINEIVFTKWDKSQTLVSLDAEQAEAIQVLDVDPNTEPIAEYYSPYRHVRVAGAFYATDPVFCRLGFVAPTNSRVGAYPPIYLKKYRGPNGELHVGPNPPAGWKRVMRADGRPDTSWAAEVLGNSTWTLQVLNAKGEAIAGATAMTRRQAPPGAKMTSCQGCHAHQKPDQTPFEETCAGLPGYKIPRLRKSTRVVYERDIAPLNLGIARDVWLVKTNADWGKVPRAFEMDQTAIDDNPAWTEQQRRLVRQWGNLGFLCAGERQKTGGIATGEFIQPASNEGPYRDEQDPTLTVETADGKLYVGAGDSYSGLKSVLIALNDQDVTSRFTFNPADDVWTYANAAEGQYVAIATDNQDNTARAEVVLTKNNAEEIALVEAAIATAEAAIEELQTELAALFARLEELRK
jgi:hypothetical protein